MPVNQGGIVNAPGRLVHEEVTFTETGGIATYTGDVFVPAGAYVVDVIVHGVAVWDNAAGVAMEVGDWTTAATPVEIDADGFLVITSIKAGGDLQAGESLSIGGAAGTTGGEEGAYITGSMTTKRYSASSRYIRGKVTAAGAGGNTGRTRMVVIYTEPTTVTAATKA